MHTYSMHMYSMHMHSMHMYSMHMYSMHMYSMGRGGGARRSHVRPSSHLPPASHPPTRPHLSLPAPYIHTSLLLRPAFKDGTRGQKSSRAASSM